MTDLHIKTIPHDEIWKAQRLLYDVYIGEQGWRLATENPSGLRVEHSKHGPLLCDHFDFQSTWVGGYVDEKVVGVHRFHRPYEGRFELEHYHPVPEFLLKAKSVECNRLAMLPEFRTTSPLIVRLLVHEFQLLRQQKMDYAFGASAFPLPGEIYLKLGLKEVNMPPFKYNDTEENDVKLIYFDFSDPVSLARFSDLSLRLAQRAR